jgi:hypothetical protein
MTNEYTFEKLLFFMTFIQYNNHEIKSYLQTKISIK